MLIIKENIYGPILEEVIYRGVIFNLLKSGGFTGSQSSIISSFLFGICNLIYLF
jgi:membrane protease YdiL (CAAX protease family)